MTTRTGAKLTEAEWSAVFQARCRSKEGRASQADHELCSRAWKEDPARYSALSDDVFNATVPAGSTAAVVDGKLRR